MSYDYNCGIFPADNVGIEYEVPDDGKREQYHYEVVPLKYNTYEVLYSVMDNGVIFRDENLGFDVFTRD